MAQSDSAGATPGFSPVVLIIGLLALGNLLNGAWMLADPAHWYVTLPAGIPDFGPLNEHFVRDLGALFVLMGGALGWSVFYPEWRLAAVAGVTGFQILHAVVHVIDTLRGLVGPEHWAIDFPAIYLPIVLLVWLFLKVRSQVR